MKYWKDALERLARTVIQAIAGTALAIVSNSGSFNNIDWNLLSSAVGYTALFTLLTALAAKGVGDKNSASFLKK